MSESAGENKPDVKPEQSGSSEHISIKVTDGNTEVFFKIKKTTPLRKVMDTFCKKTGKDINALRFLADGDRIQADDTPAKVCFIVFLTNTNSLFL